MSLISVRPPSSTSASCSAYVAMIEAGLVEALPQIKRGFLPISTAQRDETQCLSTNNLDSRFRRTIRRAGTHPRGRKDCAARISFLQHFFLQSFSSSPANVIALLEILLGAATAPDVSLANLPVALRAGFSDKVPRSTVWRGKVFGSDNRMSRRDRSVEPESLCWLEGLSAREVMPLSTGFGFPMGPFAMAIWPGSMSAGGIPKGGGERKTEIEDALVRAGHCCQKTGSDTFAMTPGHAPRCRIPKVEAHLIAEALGPGATLSAPFDPA